MAGQITCDLCGEEYAISMITRLDNGDSLAVGQSCLLTVHLTVATELIKALSPENADTYIEPVNTLIDAYGQLGAAAGILGAGAGPDEDPTTGDMITYPRAGLAGDAGTEPPGGTEPSEHTEGPADEHTADRTAPPDGHGTPPASGHGSARRPGRGGVHRRG